MTDEVKVLRIDDERLQEVIPGKFQFKHLHGQGLSVGLYKMRSADEIPTAYNYHEEEVTIMLKGSCKITIDGEDIILGPGDTIMIPGFKEHFGEFLSDEVVLVSVFAPKREEWGPESDTAPKLSFLGDGAQD